MIDELITDEFWNRLIEYIKTPEQDQEDNECLVSPLKR
jgi:hypothetical protein